MSQHDGVKCLKLPMDQRHQRFMGLIIGRHGIVFKNIIRTSHCLSIYYNRLENNIAIYGSCECIYQAAQMLLYHLQHVLDRHYYVEGYSHLPNGLRPIRFFRS
jgi:hypothetical protein